MEVVSPRVKMIQDHIQKIDQPVWKARGENGTCSSPIPVGLPKFHASAQSAWHRIIAYEACVRLCLDAWAKQSMEAPLFLENECAILRAAFGLQEVLLQPEKELLAKRSSELAGGGTAPNPKTILRKIKVQVRKVKMTAEPHSCCNLSMIKVPMKKLEVVLHQLNNIPLRFSSWLRGLRKVHISARVQPNGSSPCQDLEFKQANVQYAKQVAEFKRFGVRTLTRSSSDSEAVQAETYCCSLRLKSVSEDDVVRMHPGSGETHIFLADSLGDDLIIEVHDAKGNLYGRALAPVASIVRSPDDKLQWLSIYCEPGHKLVGRLQLCISYSTSLDESSHNKCGQVSETVVYDLVLETAMKVQQFKQRKILLDDPWKWLIKEFASYFCVSDSYTKLRYLSYVMEVTTPTVDCLEVVYELLEPVVIKGRKNLSYLENEILGEILDQINRILALVFENYKSLDESVPSGIVDSLSPQPAFVAPALKQALELYKLLHDILSTEARDKLCGYFQAAAKKRLKRYLDKTGALDSQKLKDLCLNIKNEIFNDLEIHRLDINHIIPSFVDLPNLSSAIYSVEIVKRLGAFLILHPSSGPLPLAELFNATADLQRDLANWNITAIGGGVDVKKLFHLNIMLWIQDMRRSLLEKCNLNKVKSKVEMTQNSRRPFVDEMYKNLEKNLKDYEFIICRCPEYAFVLEKTVVDVEEAIMEALEKQYADVLYPLKERNPMKYGVNFAHKLTKRPISPYVVPDDLGTFLNSMKRMLDSLWPNIEQQLNSWRSYKEGNTTLGDLHREFKSKLQKRFHDYVQAVVKKLAENTRIHKKTKLKKILHDLKENAVESNIKVQMQPLNKQLESTIYHLHKIFEKPVFISICRSYWDRMGQDVLSFMKRRKMTNLLEKRSKIVVSILDSKFASQMEKLLGNALHEKDLYPPKTIAELRSLLC